MTAPSPTDATRETDVIDDEPFDDSVPPVALGITLLYLIFLGGGLLWVYLADFTLVESFDTVEFTFEILAALIAGTLLVGGVGLIWKHTFIFRNVEPAFAERLGNTDMKGVVVLAVVSSLAEEVVFRGALQPTLANLLGGPYLGCLVTSLVFGLLHTGPSRLFFAWTAFATVAGFVLGVAYILTGNLIVPIVIHFIINAVNMWLIVNRAKWRRYQDKLRVETGAQEIVGS